MHWSVGVRVDGEVLAADVVVIAMGPWTRAAAEWCEGVPRIGGQKAHSIVLQPATPLTADCIFLDHASKQGTISWLLSKRLVWHAIDAGESGDSSQNQNLQNVHKYMRTRESKYGHHVLNSLDSRTWQDML